MVSKPSILSRVYPGHLYYLFLDISPTYFSNIICKKKDLENWKIWKSQKSILESWLIRFLPEMDQYRAKIHEKYYNNLKSENTVKKLKIWKSQKSILES